MSSNAPSTPVKVPSSAANHTQATLDPDLRSQINTVLLRDGHVSKYAPLSLASFYHDNPLTHYPRIQDALLHALNSHSTNWPTAIQSHALALLRSGEVTTFPALLSRVLEDVRHDSALNPIPSSSNGTSAKPATNGDATKTNGATDAKPSLAVPESVIDEALRVTRESLEAVCDIEDEGTA
ncbi:hypothetical protein BFJ72_g14487 [Fusarium proliferatum]|uniref:Uncharacterized protein n=1 Tax=Gibberella intermedia TaxID=948311 RepID=A0A420S2L3_GIBIN|nr:hypothetical protein FPRO03_11171 [Fusarium proliferatum]RKL23536.1 hypothetical protein BFJ72_g14487 [Fusarium proliferatum]